MRVTVRHTFASDPVRVHAMFMDPDFLEHACRRLNAEGCRVSVTGDESAVSAAVPSPDAARGFLGRTMPTRLKYVWQPPAEDGSRTGTVQLTVEGAPVLVTGETALRPVAEGTEFALDADVTVNVPLIGRTVEKATAPELARLFKAQAGIGDAWLARA